MSSTSTLSVTYFPEATEEASVVETPLKSVASTYERLKRVFDITIASLLLLLISPILAILAVIIKLTDRGPVFFSQTRVGRNGKHFRCFKLRSMVPDAEALKAKIASMNSHSDDRTFKAVNDPRITPIGRLIRKTSLDEVPQLWNVLRGDMSIVGPRPPLPSEVDRYSTEDLRRLEVQPGLTCYWQVRGRGDVPFAEQVKLDIAYIQDRNLWVDLKLTLLTLPAVISGKGAY